jgi:5-methylcytosine-specific restriction endonuclease McrBC regulatory subunit McrC
MLVREGRRVVIIADAKWKRIELSHTGHLKPARSDMYQMHAYASAYEADRMALIYPGHSGIKGARETTFLLPRVGSRQPAVSIVCIDVERDELPIVIGAEALLDTLAVV